MFVVFDLDGTIADITHRAHLVRDSKPDWDAFFAACVGDAPNRPVIDSLWAHLEVGNRVEIWSARSDVVRAETEAWLEQQGIPARLLTRMRAAGDNTPDVVLKRHWLMQLHESERPDVVYDDRQRVVDMWRDEGIACFQVAPNWEAPRKIAPTRDDLLRLLVGPAGAGKSSYARDEFPPSWVLSSDALRGIYCGDFRDQTRNSDVFTALHRLVRARLDCGLPVVVDATNLRRRDRVALAAMAPAGTTVEYIVIDRPLGEKLNSGGWRNEVMIGDDHLIVAHHKRMQSALKDILAGDGMPNVRVIDKRTDETGNRVAA